MHVLATILAHASHVPLVCTPIGFGVIEWWVEQLDQRSVAADESRIDSVHGPVRALRIGRSGQYRPALRDRIDPAFGVTRRSERQRAVPGKNIPARAITPVAGVDVLVESALLVLLKG